MRQYSKGLNSRERLITSSRDFFNQYGLSFTLNNLAKSLNITLGMVTYYFPTKDHLFVAIADDYELKLSELRSKSADESYNLAILYRAAERVMDLQYEYRCVMHYAASSSKNQSELFSHLSEKFRNNRNMILLSVKALVANGDLNEAILEEENYSIFLFCYTNLFTNWVINLEIYDIDKSYQIMKPIYLKGIFSAYLPYFTPKGFATLEKIGVNFK
ncbi:MAG: TetR/AcrR family transcriptional regulator [Lentimicrobium sp.]